jgi:hypothetical protein
MSEPYLQEQLLIDLMHDLLNDAVALNLSTGLAYGMPPSHPCPFVLVFSSIHGTLSSILLDV